MYGSPLYFIVGQRFSVNPLCTQILESHTGDHDMEGRVLHKITNSLKNNVTKITTIGNQYYSANKVLQDIRLKTLHVACAVRRVKKSD